MNLKEKQEKLESIKETLKKEFVGLDSIIDNIILSVSPWYLTPEICSRPVIVSLWGMTGTGKTSLVNRLVTLLGKTEKTINFDCGCESNTSYSGSIIDKLEDLLVDSNNSLYMSSDYTKDMIFILDEFQHARTLNEEGREVNNAQLRPIWSLIDSGILYRFDNYRYTFSQIMDSFSRIEMIAYSQPTLAVEKLKIKDKTWLEKLRKNELIETNKSDEYELIPKIAAEYLCFYLKRSENNIELWNKLIGATNINDVFIILKDIIKILVKPRKFDCSGSLVFILGNLDEAYNRSLEGINLNSDIDADTFYDLTKKVSIVDIKKALLKRFRYEQVSRFGNNLIKFPTIKKADFMKIIKSELKKISEKFKAEYSISLNIDNSIYSIMYSEGVTPDQGVRPLLSTIGTLFTPILSKIALSYKAGDIVNISSADKKLKMEDFYRLAETDLIISSGSVEIKITIPLQMGELRQPERSKDRYIKAVHEIGHAIVFSIRTGKLSSEIVSVTSNNPGGFCMTLNDEDNKIMTVRDIKSSVMTSMAGYLAERLVFSNDPDMVLLGSGSDINSAWNILTHHAYKFGLFPSFFGSWSAEEIEKNSNGIPSGFNDKDLKTEIDKFWWFSEDETKTILKENKKLLIKAALVLGEKGKIKSEEFKELIKNYGNTLNLEEMEKTKEKYSEFGYKDKLLKLL